MEKARGANAWTIDYSSEKKCAYISTNDYHADSLKLSADQLRNMLQILDPADKPVTLSADLQDVKTKTSPFYGISKREKTFGPSDFRVGEKSIFKDYYTELTSIKRPFSHLSCLPEERWRQRRAPGEHSDPSCSVVLRAFRKLAR